MKEKKLYQCEICFTDYADKDECKKCERSHKICKLVEARYTSYKNNNTGFPLKVRIEAEGESRWYKLIRNNFE